MKVLITGANRGLGLAFSKIFAENGHTVVAGVRDINHVESLQHLQAQCSGSIEIIRMDVSDESSVIQAAEEVDRRFGAIDVIINNAGIILGAEDTIEQLNLAEVESVMDVNVMGAVRVLKYFVPLLYKGENQVIINVTSEGGSITGGGGGVYIAYCMSKIALNMLNQIMCSYLGDRGIKSYAVHPGRVKTDMGGPNAEIEPWVAARGIYDIVMGKTPVDSEIKFIDYLGRPMPL